MQKTGFTLKLTLAVFILGMTGGCASKAMNHAITSWQDQQAAEVIAAWGKPSEDLNIEGKRLLIWNVYEGKLATPDTKQPSPPSNRRYCTRLLKADRTGKIIGGAWDGNDCPGWLSGWTW